MVHLWPQPIHAAEMFGAVAVAVHVPAAVGNGHKTATGFAQPTGQQQLLAEQVGGPVHVEKRLWMTIGEQLAGVVTLDQTRVFLRQIERIGHASRDHVERLLLKLIHAGNGLRGIGPMFQSVELAQQFPTAIEASGRNFQLHVLLQLAAADGIEGGIVGPKFARVGQCGQSTGFKVAFQS